MVIIRTQHVPHVIYYQLICTATRYCNYLLGTQAKRKFCNDNISWPWCVPSISNSFCLLLAKFSIFEKSIAEIHIPDIVIYD